MVQRQLKHSCLKHIVLCVEKQLQITWLCLDCSHFIVGEILQYQYPNQPGRAPLNTGIPLVWMDGIFLNDNRTVYAHPPFADSDEELDDKHDPEKGLI